MLKKIFIITTLLVSFANAKEDKDEAIDQIQNRLNEITDQVEKLRHKNEILTKKIENLSLDLDHRLKPSEKNNMTVENELEKKEIHKKTAKNYFDQAYQLIKEQKYAEAEKVFVQLIENYPNNEYTGPAYYWLGESFALRKRADKAAINYILCFQKFPKGTKADLSVIKAAGALRALNKKKEACEILAKLKPKKATFSPALQKLYQREFLQNSCKQK